MAFHHNLSQELPIHHFSNQSQQQQQPHVTENTNAPNWLNTALLRSQQSQQPPPPHFTDTNFLNLHTTANAPTSTTAPSPTSNNNSNSAWLSRSSSLLNRNHSDVIDDVTAATDSIIAGSMSHESADLKTSSDTMNAVAANCNKSEGGVGESGVEGMMNWQNARFKSEILAHPLYDQLLSAHVACLRIATPVDQLPRIDAQLAQSQQVVAKYSALGQGLVPDDKELDQFMVRVVCYNQIVVCNSPFLFFYLH